MGLFSRMKEPVFLKEGSNAEKQLEAYKGLETKLNEEGKVLLHQEIKCLEYGIAGEKNLAYELKNSHIPMYILHDIYLDDGEFSAQIDYLVITRKICFVIECKNLIGNIEINNAGDFIRTVDYGGKKKKEGIYSPITQNQRHMDILKKIKVETKNNFFIKLLAEKNFDTFYKSLVVLANPYTVLNAKYAKKEIKEKVVRADQLINYIKDAYNNSKELPDTDEEMLQWANSFLRLHKEVDKDYTKRYERYMRITDKYSREYSENTVNNNASENIEKRVNGVDNLGNNNLIENSELYLNLKAYRLQKSREEKIKPYYIYNDNQLKDLLYKMPATKEELLTVSGIGPNKVEKYGEDILEILHHS